MQGDRLRTDLPIFERLPQHHEPVPFYLTRSMFGGIPLDLAGGEISDKVGRPVADPHRHDVPEIYVLLSAEPGEAVIDVEVDGQSYELSSPAALYVPAGSLHRFLTRSARPGSYCLGILLHQ